MRGVSWGLHKAPGKFQRARDVQQARGARGVSWGFPEASGRSQGPRDAQGVRGASWERGEQAGGKASKLEAF